MFSVKLLNNFRNNFSPIKRTLVKAKVFVYDKAFDGPAKVTDFKLIEEDLPALKDGEFLAEAAFLSVDPYMRAYAPFLKTGTAHIGEQVAKIVESKHPDFPVGKYVVGFFGWRSHTVSNGGLYPRVFKSKPYLLPDIGKFSPSLGLGILGMPGNTAYFGLLDVLHPKAAETLVVSGAAGAVGNLVGQIGKIKGLTVIGIAGSDEKGKWLTKDLGYDYFINYKTDNVFEKLKEIVPDGVDCYFDNVGGVITTAVLQNMKLFGRVSICGLIAAYNGDDSKAFIDQRTIIFKQLKLEGFVVHRWLDRWMEGIEQNLKWIKEGKLKYQETITEGFENMPNAFIDMMNGGNTGKALVKA